jgi:hypothetical protein
MREDNSGPVATDELRAAIEARDTLIERVRGLDINTPGDPSLLAEMYAACVHVEELAR